MHTDVPYVSNANVFGTPLWAYVHVPPPPSQVWALSQWTPRGLLAQAPRYHPLFRRFARSRALFDCLQGSRQVLGAASAAELVQLATGFARLAVQPGALWMVLHRR